MPSRRIWPGRVDAYSMAEPCARVKRCRSRWGRPSPGRRPELRWMWVTICQAVDLRARSCYTTAPPPLADWLGRVAPFDSPRSKSR